MRIAMISEHASPLVVGGLGMQDAGGQNVHVAALADALAARGHDVEVLTRRDDADLPAEVTLPTGVRVVHVPAGPATALPKDDLAPFMPAFGEWAAARWREGRVPDVLHAHFWMSGTAALRARARVGVPVLQTFHALGTVKRRHQGSADSSPTGRIRAERGLARKVDALVATCTDEVRELLAMDAPAARVHVVPCGVDLAAFAPAGPGTGHDDASLVPPRRPGVARIVSLGRLVPRKGVATVVAALAHVPDAELVVAGGPDRSELASDAEAVRLVELAQRFGVADRVHLIGRLDRAASAALLRSADVVACVPWYEPFGIVPLEAMACGVPVVASRVGGMLDTVGDGVTGLHVPPRDPAALADALRLLLADPARRLRMSRAARAWATRYDWSRVAADTEAVYGEVLARRGLRSVSGTAAGPAAAAGVA
ncbi:MAG: glycosyltransferase [Kineosporiaceae bacterium]